MNELFCSIEAMDVAGVVGMIAADGTLRFANQERVVGRPGMPQANESMCLTIRALSYSITGVWSGIWKKGAAVSVRGEVTYTRPDGVRLAPLPATTTCVANRA